MKKFLVSAGILSSIVFLFLFDRLMDKLPSWSQSALKYIIIAGIFTVIGDTFFGLFYKPSPEEVAVRRIDMFLGRAENFNDSDESSQKTVEP